MKVNEITFLGDGYDAWPLLQTEWSRHMGNAVICALTQHKSACVCAVSKTSTLCSREQEWDGIFPSFLWNPWWIV